MLTSPANSAAETLALPLVLCEPPDAVGGSEELSHVNTDFALVAGFDTARAFGAATAEWLLLSVHRSEIGAAEARLAPREQQISWTRWWRAAEPVYDVPWTPALPSLGRMGCKLGGRPGYLQHELGEERALLAEGYVFLAQLDCEDDALLERTKSLLCGGALYVFGKFASPGRQRLVEARVFWQV
jgi:hypothetical protein